MKKSILLPAAMLLVLITFSGFTQDVKIFQSDKLVKKWETAPVFKVPESVCYAGGNLLYVANINGKPTDKDGNGYISMITTFVMKVFPKRVVFHPDCILPVFLLYRFL